MNRLTVTAMASCREFKDEPTSGATWFQTFPPYGEYPVAGTIKGAAKDAVYIIDEAAAKAVIENFRSAAREDGWPGILVDREHNSLDPKKPSDAMAWAKDIRQEADGSIWTRWEFTPTGRELWTTRTLVNRSPAFLASCEGGKYRPFELRSIGMTNIPHFKQLSTIAAAKEADQNQTGETMKKMLEALGLAEGASEDDAVAAINELKNKASAAQAQAEESKKKAEEAEAKCRKVECDAFIEANKHKIADEAACRKAYMADPVMAKNIIAACRVSEAQPTQTVLASAKKTPDVKTGGKAFASCREEMAALPPSQRAAYYAAHKAEIENEK